VLTVRTADAMAEYAPMRWGLVPSWHEEGDPLPAYFNARAETVASKPSFRRAFQSRRCLVPAAGFYEWLRDGNRKRPHFIQRPGGDPFALAAIWDRWFHFRPDDPAQRLGGSGCFNPLESFAIITTEANTDVRTLHDRMPVILPRKHFDRWLDPDADPAALQPLLSPAPAGTLVAYEVSPVVNHWRFDDARCVEPV
jgi:putative SOS response-associated peptidase YedK